MVFFSAARGRRRRRPSAAFFLARRRRFVRGLGGLWEVDARSRGGSGRSQRGRARDDDGRDSGSQEEGGLGRRRRARGLLLLLLLLLPSLSLSPPRSDRAACSRRGAATSQEQLGASLRPDQALEGSRKRRRAGQLEGRLSAASSVAAAAFAPSPPLRCLSPAQNAAGRDRADDELCVRRASSRRRRVQGAAIGPRGLRWWPASERRESEGGGVGRLLSPLSARARGLPTSSLSVITTRRLMMWWRTFSLKREKVRGKRARGRRAGGVRFGLEERERRGRGERARGETEKALSPLSAHAHIKFPPPSFRPTHTHTHTLADDTHRALWPV